MIWFLDFEKRFSSMFELEETYSNNGLGGSYRISSQYQRQSLSKQINQAVFRFKKNSIIPSSILEKEGFQLEHIDFQELYDDIEYKQLSKQSTINQFDVLTVTKYPIFCFFARILQIIEESIDQSRHLKNWDYINIERSVLAGLLIVMKSSGQRVSFYHALYRFHRILLGINDLRQRILVDINSKNHSQINCAYSSQSNTTSQSQSGSLNSKYDYSNTKSDKYHSPNQLNGKISHPSIFHQKNESKKKEIQQDPDCIIEGEDSKNKSVDIENQNKNIFTTPKLKSQNSNNIKNLGNLYGNQQQERKISGMFKNLISSPSSPKSPIISQSEREFLLVTYEIFYFTHKYSQIYLYDNVHEGEYLNFKLNLILKKNLYSSGDKNINRSSLSSGYNSGNRSPSTSEILEEETENNKLQQIFNLAQSYLQENQKQYLVPRQKISSIDLDYNVNQTIASFTQKLSDGYKSTCSFSSGQTSFYQQQSNQSNQFNNNKTSFSIGDTNMFKSINSCFDQINISLSLNQNNLIDQSKYAIQEQPVQCLHKGSYQYDNISVQNAHNTRIKSESNITYSQHPQQCNCSSQTHAKNQNKSRERQFSIVGANYLESLKQACEEQDDQVNNYLKMLLYRSKKSQFKTDNSLKYNHRIQTKSQKSSPQKKRISFGSTSITLQNENQSNQYDSLQKDEINPQYKDIEVNQQNMIQNILANFGSKQQSSRSNSFGSSFSEKRYQDFCQNSIDEQIFEEDKDEIKEDYTLDQDKQQKHADQNNQQETQVEQKYNRGNESNYSNSIFSKNQCIRIQQQNNFINLEKGDNLSIGQSGKKSQTYVVSLMQEVKEEKEDSEQFNSNFDNSKLKQGISPSTHSSIQDNRKSQEKIKQGRIDNSQSSDMQPNIDQFTQNNSSQSSINEKQTHLINQKYKQSPQLNKRKSNISKENNETQQKKNYSSQQSEDNDESRSSSSSSSSNYSSASSLSSQNSQQQQSDDKSQRHKSSTISNKKYQKDKITERILQYSNDLIQKSKQSRIKQKRSHKIRKKYSHESQELERQNSNSSSSKRSSKVNRSFESEQSSASDIKKKNQAEGGELPSSLFNELDQRIVRLKNPLQRRGGIQVKTVQRHMTKSGKEFDTLGVVKPNFNVINEIDQNQISQIGVTSQKDYPKQNKKFSSESSETFASRKSSESLNQSLNLSQIMANSINKTSLDNQNPYKLSNQQTIAKATTNQLIEMGILNKQNTHNQANKSQDKKNIKKHSSQDSISSGSEIKPKKKNSFFQKVLNFFHKIQPRDIINLRNQSISPTNAAETPSNKNSGYIPPNLDSSTDKYFKRSISINGSTFFKIRDVINHEQRRVKMSSMQQSYLYFDQSYQSVSKREDVDYKTPSMQQVNSMIYYSKPEQHIQQSMLKQQQSFSLSQNSFSDQNSIEQQIKLQSEKDQQFEKDLSELFDSQQNQAEYDLQDRKNSLVCLYGIIIISILILLQDFLIFIQWMIWI